MLSGFYYLFLLQDSDMIVDDVVTSSLGGDDLQTAAVDQDKNLGKSVQDSPKAGVESAEGGHSSSSDSFFDTTPNSVPEEQILSAGSTTDDDDMPRADDSNIVFNLWALTSITTHNDFVFIGIIRPGSCNRNFMLHSSICLYSDNIYVSLYY